MAPVKEGDTVKIHYTGKLENSEVFDSSRDREPLEFKLGAGGLIPGFETAVMGMHPTDTKTVTIPSDQAYGPKMDQLIFEVERTQLPHDLEPQAGMQLAVTSPDGKQVPVWILEVMEKTVKLDGNHPLAGKDLIFDLELVEIVSAA
ncbi:peptidylprolyl isomerase [bacterium]|nr:peptidylprolyl isomerase [bacterium]